MSYSHADLEARIDVMLPPMPGWCTPDKGKRIARLAADMRANLCVELGVFGGRSLVALASGLAVNKVGRVHGIDPFTKDAALEGTNGEANNEWWAKLDYEEIRAHAIVAVEKHGLQPYTALIREKSQDVVDRYGDGTIDILHQDSNHSAEVSTAEVRAWSPKLRLGGFWIFDDIDWESTQGARQLLLKTGFQLIERYDQWGIFQRGTTSA
jgi:Methyltransferase domain